MLSAIRLQSGLGRQSITPVHHITHFALIYRHRHPPTLLLPPILTAGCTLSLAVHACQRTAVSRAPSAHLPDVGGREAPVSLSFSHSLSPVQLISVVPRAKTGAFPAANRHVRYKAHFIAGHRPCNSPPGVLFYTFGSSSTPCLSTRSARNPWVVVVVRRTLLAAPSDTSVRSAAQRSSAQLTA